MNPGHHAAEGHSRQDQRIGVCQVGNRGIHRRGAEVAEEGDRELGIAIKALKHQGIKGRRDRSNAAALDASAPRCLGRVGSGAPVSLISRWLDLLKPATTLLRIVAVVTSLALGATGACMGAGVQNTGVLAAGALAQDQEADEVATPSSDDAAAVRPPLLREGSALVEAVASLEFDAQRNRWLLNVAGPDADQPPFVLTVLPCSLLEEIERIVRASGPGARPRFQVTGEVYVFGGENYFLPLYAPQLVGYDESPRSRTGTSTPADQSSGETSDFGERTGEATGDGASAAAADQADQTDEPDRDSIEAIKRRLAEASGPIQRSPASGAEEPQADAEIVHVDGGPSLLREGTEIVQRRGRLQRHESGAWMFIFDADATAKSDPPVFLLPCRLLERLSDFAAANPGHRAVLLSGRVYRYGGRHYLLPTLMQVPREKTLLSR